MSPALLCWHLIIMFVTAPHSYKKPQQNRAKENPQPDMNVNDPYRWGRHIFDGLIPLQSFKADDICKIQIYLLDLAEQLLGVGFFNIYERLRGPEWRLAHRAKHDPSSCTVLSTALSWVCFLLLYHFISLSTSLLLFWITEWNSVDTRFC